jgi:hypothetical protein
VVAAVEGRLAVKVPVAAAGPAVPAADAAALAEAPAEGQIEGQIEGRIEAADLVTDRSY